MMDALTWFGFLSLAGAMVCYALEERSHWYGLGFAIGCVLGSIYGFLIGAWPFGVVEAHLDRHRAASLARVTEARRGLIAAQKPDAISAGMLTLGGGRPCRAASQALGSQAFGMSSRRLCATFCWKRFQPCAPTSA